MACHYGISESLIEENITDAEVPGYRFQRQRQRHVLEDKPEANGRDEYEKEDTREGKLTK